MKESIRRILAMYLRYLYLHKRSLPRTLEIVFWPVMDLLVWGFVTLFIQSLVESELLKTLVFLINAMIFWDILYRGQQGVTISFMEEIWQQNIINLLASPLKIWEWCAATFIYGLTKILVITTILAGIALGLYQFNLIGNLGFYLIPLAANLLLFAWGLGLFTAGLLIRWGYAVEALIWGVPFLIQPISAVFYPLAILPPSVQWIAKGLPSTYVFEGMRSILREGTMPYDYFLTALGLNGIYFILGTLFFQWMYSRALVTGRLVRLGMD
jgi:ABC-2 type transport system permease protein